MTPACKRSAPAGRPELARLATPLPGRSYFDLATAYVSGTLSAFPDARPGLACDHPEAGCLGSRSPWRTPGADGGRRLPARTVEETPCYRGRQAPRNRRYLVRAIVKAGAALSVVAVLATACAKPASNNAGTTTKPKFTACMVTDTGGIDDKSFNQSSWLGMKAAAAAMPGTISVQYLPSTTTADYAKNISTFITRKCGIIVTVGFLMGSATEAAAKANPKQKFAIVDCSYSS